MVAVPALVAQRRLTFDDYLALPDDQDYEIIEGVVYVAPRARPRHQIIAANFTSFLTVELTQRGLGTVVPDADLIIDERGTYVSPDIMFFAGERFQQVDPNDWIRIVPDLIIEVLSPSTADYDRGMKRLTYAALGVEHYWIVDLDRQRLTECVLQPNGTYADQVFTLTTPFTPAIFRHLAVDLGRLLA